MGKTLQVRGTLQCIDLRTLNAEISEVMKQDMDEVDKRSIKELIIPGGTTDQEIDFALDGIAPAKFIYFTADNATTVKINDSVTAGTSWTFALIFGEISKLYLTTTVQTHVRVIALA